MSLPHKIESILSQVRNKHEASFKWVKCLNSNFCDGIYEEVFKESAHETKKREALASLRGNGFHVNYGKQPSFCQRKNELFLFSSVM